ncbi:MAG: hypothetical protein FRX48_06544 [Lasallia pustulata]|uniref:Uncharacterized protein n=1 Tax=Lasallia pustulata TaxID=136370 RepID=A0A5M8PKS4_9LECA|nr:MAG: hypothetical protein FRX48_06544 [Lasallia pustulata]
MLPLQHGPVMADIAPAGADAGQRNTYTKNIYAATLESGSQANAQTASYDERPMSPPTSTQLSSNEASQSSTWDYQRRAETPPTTVSNPSSQVQPQKVAQKVAQESKQRGTVSVRVLGPYPRNHPPPLDTNVAQRSVTHAIGPDAEYSHGQKRTANGETKSGGASSPRSPIPTTPRRHAKHASVSSNGSQIGELSAQLRTRLSYAMVKVQHGWQTRTISEVETLVSQNPSPISPSPISPSPISPSPSPPPPPAPLTLSTPPLHPHHHLPTGPPYLRPILRALHRRPQLPPPRPPPPPRLPHPPHNQLYSPSLTSPNPSAPTPQSPPTRTLPSPPPSTSTRATPPVAPSTRTRPPP